MAALAKEALETNCPYNGPTVAVVCHELRRRPGFPWFTLKRALRCTGCAAQLPSESHSTVSSNATRTRGVHDGD
jgi:hypothetical protein